MAVSVVFHYLKFTRDITPTSRHYGYLKTTTTTILTQCIDAFQLLVPTKSSRTKEQYTVANKIIEGKMKKWMEGWIERKLKLNSVDDWVNYGIHM